MQDIEQIEGVGRRREEAAEEEDTATCPLRAPDETHGEAPDPGPLVVMRREV